VNRRWPALLVGAALVACASEADLAIEHATSEARAEAERGRQQVESVVREVADRDAALARAVEVDPERVFGSRATADGFEVDAVFYGQGQAGGGWTAESRSVRLCVRFVAHAGEVRAQDVDCTDAVPMESPRFGTVHRTVRLAD
jgi:hypothetical protein